MYSRYPGKGRSFARRLFQIGLLLLLSAGSLQVICGCVAQKREKVREAVEQAGTPELGTRISWTRGQGTKGEGEILKGPNGHWATSARASSSLGNVSDRIGWKPEEATGAPDVERFKVDQRGWGPEKENAGLEWLETRFDPPIHAIGVRVRVVHGCGCLVMVQLRAIDGNYHLKWKGKDRPNKFITWMVLDFPRTEYLVDAVRVTLDTTLVPHWKVIDAVQLLGTP